MRVRGRHTWLAGVVCSVGCVHAVCPCGVSVLRELLVDPPPSTLMHRVFTRGCDVAVAGHRYTKRVVQETLRLYPISA